MLRSKLATCPEGELAAFLQELRAEEQVPHCPRHGMPDTRLRRCLSPSSACVQKAEGPELIEQYSKLPNWYKRHTTYKKNG